VAPYLKKGTQVYVEGTPEVRSYTKNDGTFGTSLTLRVSNVQLLGSRADQSGGYEQPSGSSAGVPVAAGGDEGESDLPF
jgi:single-strand DNA-binding protein